MGIANSLINSGNAVLLEQIKTNNTGYCKGND